MQWGASFEVWSFSSFLRNFALGSCKEVCTCLAKPIGSVGVGTFTSSGHQAGVSTQWAHHLTHSWELSKGSLGIADRSGSSPLPLDTSVPDRNSHTGGSKTGESPRSPQQIGTNLQSHLNCWIMRHGHPLPWAE